MPDKVIQVYKKSGETPLDCIDNLKKTNPKFKHLPMTYAGRLDPLAEGVLLILVGDECMKKDEYLVLSKEYEVDILFGFATDTYDMMGKVVNTETLSDNFHNASSSENLQKDIQNMLPEFIGQIKQLYPPYSSRTVLGKPLFKWAREDKLDEIEIPMHDVVVEDIKIIKSEVIRGDKLLKNIKEKISKVEGDFRQKEIISLWNDELKEKEDIKYPYIRLRISCGSGVYVRVIAHEIGNKLGVPALAYKIVRTKIGKYAI